MPPFSDMPVIGAGIGLRTQHYQEILVNRPPVRWFEVLSENYFGAGGLPLYHLEQVRESYPITMHGVGMSLGSTDPLDFNYLAKLKALAERFEPVWISDHLAWISVNRRYTHDLLPLPYTEEALSHVARRVIQAEDFLGRRLLIENPATYLSFNHSEMTEWEFVQGLVDRTDCELLIDVNNIYVSATNHGFDPMDYIKAVPKERVREIHLAGYEEREDYLFDTHGCRVHPPVWELYRAALEYFGPVPTLIEWDTDIPPFSVLVEEAEKAQAQLDVAA
ncbi:MAG: DUF692 domain-containing protein [Proteobacteria bacterium]|nr:DUF692 domain-containing protein [Pseudomonadota bacterium]